MLSPRRKAAQCPVWQGGLRLVAPRAGDGAPPSQRISGAHPCCVMSCAWYRSSLLAMLLNSHSRGSIPAGTESALDEQIQQSCTSSRLPGGDPCCADSPGLGLVQTPASPDGAVPFWCFVPRFFFSCWLRRGGEACLIVTAIAVLTTVCVLLFFCLFVCFLLFHSRRGPASPTRPTIIRPAEPSLLDL